MIKIYNNYITIDYSDIKNISLRKFDESTESYQPLYRIRNNKYIIPILFEKYLNSKYFVYNKPFKDIPKEIHKVKTIHRGKFHLESSAHLSDKVILRSDQRQALELLRDYGRGLVQLATGSGKTEILASFIKLIISSNKENPGILILEPTTYLVDSISERLNSYGIETVSYKKIRKSSIERHLLDIEGKVVVTHPRSLVNDLENNLIHLSNLRVLLEDECHHTSSNTWETINFYAKNIEINVGVSASAIRRDLLPIHCNDYLESKLDFTEIKVLGFLKRVLIDRAPSYYIDNKILSKPILFRVNYRFSEEELKEYSEMRARESYKGSYMPSKFVNMRIYQKALSYLESNRRNEFISNIANNLVNKFNMKILILVYKRSHGLELLQKIHNLGVKCRCSFGNKEFYKIENGEPVIDNSEDVMGQFNEGKISLMIGTSHIYEGVDIKCLDGLILASVGKSDRKLIQGVGRVVRKSKSTKYAYIIDFTDEGIYTFERHSKLRLSTFKSDIGVGERGNDIFDTTDENMYQLVNLLENVV